MDQSGDKSEHKSELKELNRMGYTGYLSLGFGPMFSGKTVWLNEELNSYSDMEKRVLKVVHTIDVRDGVLGSSHDSDSKPNSNVDIIVADKLSEVDITNYDVIGVDEAQFFPDLKSVVLDWISSGKPIIFVAGLDGDFNREKFGQILDLIPHSDEAVKFRAECDYCRKNLFGSNSPLINSTLISGPLTNGIFSKRIIDSSEQICVGGSSEYRPTCRYHYYNS